MLHLTQLPNICLPVKRTAFKPVKERKWNDDDDSKKEKSTGFCPSTPSAQDAVGQFDSRGTIRPGFVGARGWVVALPTQPDVQ